MNTLKHDEIRQAVRQTYGKIAQTDAACGVAQAATTVAQWGGAGGRRPLVWPDTLVRLSLNT